MQRKCLKESSDDLSPSIWPRATWSKAPSNLSLILIYQLPWHNRYPGLQGDRIWNWKARKHQDIHVHNNTHTHTKGTITWLHIQKQTHTHRVHTHFPTSKWSYTEGHSKMNLRKGLGLFEKIKRPTPTLITDLLRDQGCDRYYVYTRLVAAPLPDPYHIHATSTEASRW